jgi:hypothetical protein
MNALAKFSIALLALTATAVAVYLYLALGDEGLDAVRSEPQDEICKQDGERLARLRANPSLDEGLKLASEIRCLQLWPQVQTLLDGLTDPSRSTTASSLNAVRSGTRSPSDVAAATPPPEPTPVALDDACTHDEDRLAELRANPSIDAAIRFDSELRCSRLKPQLPAVLDSLSHATGSVGPAGRNTSALNSTSTAETAPAAPASVARDVTSPTSDDACKRDEERLADLQANRSRDEAARFIGELKCSKLLPQVLALLDSLSQAPPSAGAPSPNVAPVDATSVGETTPPASELRAAEPASATLDDACKRDEDHLDRLRENPSREEAARFAEELSCERLRPQLLALVGDLAKPPLPSAGDASQDAAVKTNTANQALSAPDASAASEAAADADRRIAALERERDALAAKVDRLERHQEMPPEQAAPPQPAVAAERSDSEPARPADADAERRIATLESEKAALAAEVDRLKRQQETSPEQVASLPPPPAAAVSASPTRAASSVGPANSEARTSDSEPGPKWAPLPDGMPARVLIRYPRNNTDARRRAEGLADALTRQGLEVADLRESDGAVRTELRFFYAPDAAIAQRIGGLVGIAPVRRLQPKDGLMARPGAIELGLSGDSHLPVITTSRKESVHE